MEYKKDRLHDVIDMIGDGPFFVFLGKMKPLYLPSQDSYCNPMATSISPDCSFSCLCG